MNKNVDSELCFVKGFDDWIIAGTLGESELIAINTLNRKTVPVCLGKNLILSMGSSIKSSEIYVLVESKDEVDNSQQTIKKVLIVDVDNENQPIVDQFEVFGDARSIHVIGDGDVLIVEGRHF